MADPVPVSHEQWPIDAQLMIEHGNRPRVRQRPQHGPAHIPRQQLPADKDEHAEQRQRHESQPEPGDQDACDRGLLSAGPTLGTTS